MVEVLQPKENTLEINKEMKEALDNFSNETNTLKEDIDKKIIEQIITNQITINGKKIELTGDKIESKNDLYTITFKINLGEGTRNIKISFKKIDVENNSYIQFEPYDQMMEWYTNEKGNKIFAPLDEKKYNGGIIYDQGITTIETKGIDIRIEENTRKTKEMREKKIRETSFLGNFPTETFTDEEIEKSNINIKTLKNTQLGKEVVEEKDGYYRPLLLQENNQCCEIARIYFTKKGEIDNKKSQDNIKPRKIAGTDIKISINENNKTFEFTNIEELKKNIKTQMKTIENYIKHAGIGDYQIFEGFNKIGEKRGEGEQKEQRKRLSIEMINDLYVFQRGKKEQDIIHFAVENNKLQLINPKGEKVNYIPVETTKNNKKEIWNITIEKEKFTFKRSNEKILENQEQPILNNTPGTLKSEYMYDWDKKNNKIHYYTEKTGMHIADIPATKNKNNERELGKIDTKVNMEHLFQDMKTKMFTDTFTENLKDLNILENDVYTAFLTLRKESKINTDNRNAISVLFDEEEGIYKYYTAKQSRKGGPIVFEQDKKLYKEMEHIKNILTENINTIRKIEQIKLFKSQSRKEKDVFTNFVGNVGMSPLTTTIKKELLNNTNNITYIKNLMWFEKGEYKNSAISFETKNGKTSVNTKDIEINSQKFGLQSKDEEKKLSLLFRLQ